MADHTSILISTASGDLSITIGSFAKAANVLNRLHEIMMRSVGFVAGGRGTSTKRYKRFCRKTSDLFPGTEIGDLEESNNYLVSPDGEWIDFSTYIQPILRAHPEFVGRSFSRVVSKEGLPSYDNEECKRVRSKREEHNLKRLAEEDERKKKRVC